MIQWFRMIEAGPPQNTLSGMFDDAPPATLSVRPTPTSHLGSFWPQDRPLRYIDLFSGIGGFHQAAAALGMECVLACNTSCASSSSMKAGLRK